jgi:ubiquinone/menaquinone biosynthesis C-methylase UbiE
MQFKDYFSKQASAYARYRPSYPNELFEYLASITPQHETAWDCATGNGQVALALTPYFQQIYATDASERQVSQAFQHDRIHYQVAPAERTELGDRSIDLITVAQALHWFDLERFYQEVRRVAKPECIVAFWAYGWFEIPTASDAAKQVLREFHELVEPFWPPERRIVEDQYRSISFPFVEQTMPAFAMTDEWTAEHLIGYLGTWSATQRLIEQQGIEPIEQFSNHLIQVWGSPQSTQEILWPLYFRVGRLSE